MSREDWLDAARTASLDDLRERILTGFKDGKPFTPYMPTVALPQRVESVLDFGCGVGRNFPYLRTLADRVTGFDLPPMIERCRALAPAGVDDLSDDWPSLRTRRFALVFSALVLQHIEYDQTLAFVRDFARMAPAVYLLTRAQSDFDHDVLDVLTGTGLLDVLDRVEVEHDASTHQLRVIRRPDVHASRDRPDMRHYELVLRPR